ncbi:MAG: two-component regulator propeller domain-containing protein [Cyclobacteriaceae bacterium]
MEKLVPNIVLSQLHKVVGTYLIFVVLLVPINFSQAQEYHNNFEKLTTQNGLAQNDVRDIYQDHLGYIWIATYDGLNRYDGYSIKTYRKELGNPNSLRSSLIGHIQEDSLGNLWVGTDDEGLSMYHRDTDSFLHFRNTLENPDLISDNHITRLMIDKSGYIWAGTPSGLNKVTMDYERHSISNQIFKHDPEDYGSIISNRITCLYQDKLGNIWIGSQEGLSRYYDTRHNDKEQFIHYNSGFLRQLSSIQETSKGLLISANSLYLLPFAEVNKTNPSFRELSGVRARRILVSNDETLWAATNNGIQIYSWDQGALGKVAQFNHQLGNNASLSSDVVTCLSVDKSGIIWAGTDGGGVNIYKPNKKNFRHFSRTEDEASITYNKIRAIFEDSDENLWIGTMGGKGLNFLSNETGKKYENGFERIKTIQGNTGHGTVYAIAEYKTEIENLILLGCGYPARFKYGTTDNVKKGEFFQGDEYIQATGPVFTILVDKDKNIWLGTYQYGLLRYRIKPDGKVIKADTFLLDENNPGSISSNIIRSLAQDHDGNIWIGTGNGVCKLPGNQLNEEVPKFTKYFHNEKDRYSISHNYILPIHVTSKGQIWIGTLGGGLNKVIRGEGSTKDHFLSYTTLDGLPNNVIKSIVEDDSGYLWCASNMGLTRFSPEKLEFQNFGLDDGLQDVEFSEIAAFKRADGELLFGGVNGFNAFHPTEIRRDTFNVDLVFGELQILNKTVGAGDTLNGRVVLNANINEVEAIQLQHDENSFSLGFSTLHYVSPMENKYAYKLEGFDKDWITTSASNRIAKYTNLPPGKYTLKVKATNSDEHWSKNELGLKINVGTPWWASYWAKSLYALLVVIGLWFFRKYTIITNTRKNEFLLEHMEKEKLEELSQLKLRFFTNISHEFRTPLTLIIGFMERLQSLSASLSETDKQKYYRNIIRNSKTLLNLINQLMGFRKLEQGKMKLKVSYNDLSNYVALLGENFYEMANQKSIDFNVKSDERILAWFDAEVMERVVFNLLSNAFKFTPEHGKITIELLESKDQISITVRDNGPGIPKEIQGHIFERFANAKLKSEPGSGIGLSFIKSLIEMHHGSIAYETMENEGTTFKVTIPNDKSTYSSEEIMGSEDSLVIEQQGESWLLPSEDDEKIIPKESKYKNYSVLLVEDNDDILFFLEETFKMDYNIFKAHEGREALDICLDKSIDLVISDVMMEGMDGFGFCKELKSDDRINHIPVILLTAKDNPESKLKGYALGADAYIPKPFSMQELQTRLEALIESRQRIVSKFQSSVELSPSEAGLTSIDEKFLKRVMTFIEDNISMTELSVEMLASECGLSQLHLNKKLKVLVGDTANSFIRSIRLKRSAQLLKKDIYSITEVMYEVGFIDAKYFRRCFKDKFGVTPKQFQMSEMKEAAG